MIWAQPGETLHWDIGRSDVIDRGNRIAIGRFELLGGEVRSADLRLDLWQAEARAVCSSPTARSSGDPSPTPAIW